MHRLTCTLGAIAASLALGACWSASHARKSEPAQRGTLANVAWSPPKTTIPEGFVKAVQALLGNGLGDPRGRKRCQVELMVGGGSWGKSRLVYADGWVGSDEKTALLADGVERPILRVVKELGKDERSAQTREGYWPPQTGPGLEYVRVATLLLLGETAAAEAEWSKIHGPSGLPEEHLARHIVDHCRIGAAQALMDGDDRAALRWAQALARAAEVRKRLGFDPGADESRLAYPGNADDCWAFWRDAQRRLAEPRPRPDLEEVKKLPEGERIEALAEALDEVAARQWGQPGGLDWNSDPLVPLFVAQGEAAVPKLLDAIEHDRRWTRSVSFGRDFMPGRRVHPVRDAAWAVLVQIWPAAATVPREEFRTWVARLRTQWASGSGKSQNERWLDVLRDDGAGQGAWLAAALALVRPQSQRTEGAWMVNDPNGSQAMAGEELRERHGAELERLLSARALAVAEVQGPMSSAHFFRMADALRIVYAAGRWSPRSALPAARELCERAVKLRADRQEFGLGSFDDHVARAFVRVVVQRSNAGDPRAAVDFGSVLEPIESRDAWGSVLRPLWECPQDAGIQEAGERCLRKILGSATSAGDARQRAHTVARLVQTPLIGNREFRRLLADAVLARDPLGTAMLTTSGGNRLVKWSMEGGGGSYSVPGHMGTKDLAEGSYPWTSGDFIADTVSHLAVSAGFCSALKEPARERARRALRRALMTNDEYWTKVADKLAASDWDNPRS